MERVKAEKQILIVEDDEDISDALTELLEDEGYFVTVVSHGQAAVDRLRHDTAPDLIILDLFMPVMDGWQFLQVFKQWFPEIHAKTPIIVTSAAGTQAENVSTEVQAFLRKPLDADELLSLVHLHCGKAVTGGPRAPTHTA